MSKLRVLVACERSGVVRSAFRALGHDAWSNDLVPADDGSPFHIQGDAVAAAYSGQWDLIIAHPECTYLANSGAKHLYAGMKMENGPEADRWAKMGAAAQFFLMLLNAPAPMVAVENPVMLGHPRRLFGIPEPTQTIQPWQFGHGETKATCLWLRGLAPLVPTNIVSGREQRVWRLPPGPERKRLRSRTFDGIAAAMADQVGRVRCCGGCCVMRPASTSANATAAASPKASASQSWSSAGHQHQSRPALCGAMGPVVHDQSNPADLQRLILPCASKAGNSGPRRHGCARFFIPANKGVAAPAVRNPCGHSGSVFFALPPAVHVHLSPRPFQRTSLDRHQPIERDVQRRGNLIQNLVRSSRELGSFIQGSAPND